MNNISKWCFQVSYDFYISTDRYKSYILKLIFHDSISRWKSNYYVNTYSKYFVSNQFFTAKSFIFYSWQWHWWYVDLLKGSSSVIFRRLIDFDFRFCHFCKRSAMLQNNALEWNIVRLNSKKVQNSSFEPSFAISVPGVLRIYPL